MRTIQSFFHSLLTSHVWLHDFHTWINMNYLNQSYYNRLFFGFMKSWFSHILGCYLHWWSIVENKLNLNQSYYNNLFLWIHEKLKIFAHIFGMLLTLQWHSWEQSEFEPVILQQPIPLDSWKAEELLTHSWMLLTFE